MQLFEEEKSVFQAKLNKALGDRDNVDTIKDLIKLLMLKDATKSETTMKLVEVYNYLGLDAFVDLIDIMNGATIQFPEIEEFKDIVKIAVSYYYKYLKHKSWDEIKTILNDNNCSSIKYGINCSKLNKFLAELSQHQEYFDKKEEITDGSV